MKNLRVIETNPGTDPRWGSFVAEHPEGSIYHHPSWLMALEQEYGQKGVYLACENAAGRLLALLPLMYTRGVPFGVGGPLGGRRLSSLPRTPTAGPLSTDSKATAAVIRAAVERVRQKPGMQLQIKMENDGLSGLVDGLVCVPWRVSYVLRLEDSQPHSFRVADRHHRSSIQRAVNKARRSGVRVRAAVTLEDLRTWYVLYLETMRRNLVPARRYRFFLSLWNLLRPQGMMKLLLAEYEENGTSTIAAGSLFLMFGRTTSFAFNASRVNDSSRRPNDLLVWEAINAALNNGSELFDFGEVGEDRPELARYKRKWGSDPVLLYRYYYPALSAYESLDGGSQGYPAWMPQTLWRHMPLSVTARVSERIYSYL